MRLAAYQPDQAGNLGAMIRVCACFGAGLDVIEPCGFALSAKALRRAAMDYGALVDARRHDGWESFLSARRPAPGRLILLTTSAPTALYDVVFTADDTLLMGSESAGAPEAVHAAADLRIRIPLVDGARSLNVAVAAAIGLAEARRQLGPA